MNDELEKFWLNFSRCKSDGSFIEQLGSTEFGNRTISNSYKTEEIKGNRILSSIELEDGIKYRKKVVRFPKSVESSRSVTKQFE